MSPVRNCQARKLKSRRTHPNPSSPSHREVWSYSCLIFSIQETLKCENLYKRVLNLNPDRGENLFDPRSTESLETLLPVQRTAWRRTTTGPRTTPSLARRSRKKY